MTFFLHYIVLVPHVTFASAPQGVPSVREAAATAPHHHVYVSLDASMVARRFLDPLGGGESDASACSDGTFLWASAPLREALLLRGRLGDQEEEDKR